MFVITCSDEGVQINEGVRIGLLGAGLNLPHQAEVFQAIKKVFGKKIGIVASADCDYVKESLDLSTMEQADASFQQHAQILADKYDLVYAGILPFADPQELGHGIKGHMVRPRGIHIANKICFTLGGGEQTYNLGQYLISAEWIDSVDKKVASEVIKFQVDYIKKMSKQDNLKFVYETEGPQKEKAESRKKLLESLIV